MADRLLNIIIIMVFVALVPGWLYASGNLPALAPQNQKVMGAVHHSFPKLADMTYVVARCTFETIRGVGFAVPHTYNERLVQIRMIREKAIDICEEILAET